MKSKSTNKRIAINSFALYLKMVYSIVVALFTTRIILSSLGVEDYGVYTLISGVVVLLSFVNVSMTIATQRFMSVTKGQNHHSKLKIIFQSSVFLHLIIGFTVVLILELLSPFLFNGFLNIASDKIQSAKYVYQFMVISTFFTINAVPYDAVINANEEMWVDSIIGFVETTLKLGIAFIIYFIDDDKLIIYSLLTAILIIIVRIIKSLYCTKKYKECRGVFKSILKPDYAIIKEMGTFAAWNALGAFVFVGRNQLLAIILNLFLGTIVNAAFGIATQINSQISTFSTTLLKAINPQIAKHEGAGNRLSMLKLADNSTRFSFLIFLLFYIPFTLETPYILSLWLKDVPEYTVMFCRFLLLSSLIIQLSNGLMLSIQSVGDIRNYTITVNTIYVLSIPISYLILRYTSSSFLVLISMVIIEIITFVTRLFIVSKKILEFNIYDYLKSTVLKLFIVSLLSLFITYFITKNLGDNLIKFSFTLIISTLIILITSFFLVIDKNTREEIKKKIKKKIVI